MTAIRRLLAPALVLSAVLATTASAQSTLPITIEVRGGAAIPTGDFDEGVSTGWGLGATVRYAVAPSVDLYAGFDHFEFGTDEELDDEEIEFGIADNGLRAGARFSFSTLGSVQPWLEGGLLVNRSTVSIGDGTTTIDVDSEWGLGFEAGAGIAVPLSPRVSLTPGVRYRMHEAKFEVEDVEEGPESIDVTYFAIDIGVNIRL
ncbi:MAG TPA: outer membrane beta-barrel protein [Longimicrobium sp.]|jgi:opacity protein-like surface antigen